MENSFTTKRLPLSSQFNSCCINVKTFFLFLFIKLVIKFRMMRQAKNKVLNIPVSFFPSKFNMTLNYFKLVSHAVINGSIFKSLLLLMAFICEASNIFSPIIIVVLCSFIELAFYLPASEASSVIVIKMMPQES